MVRAKRPRRSNGFTLVELMVVIAIIGLLATVVTVNVMSHMDSARVTKAKVDIKAIDDAIKLYKINPKSKGRYPASLNDLFQGGNSAIDGKNSADELLDPWGAKYNYVPPSSGSNYDIFSYGEDGGPGGTGNAADIHLKDALSNN